MSASTNLPLPSGLPVTTTRIEQDLLRSLEGLHDRDVQEENLWKLAIYYQQELQRDDLAVRLLEIVIEESEDPERKALAYLTLGQFAQARDKWVIACEHYQRALSFKPTDSSVLYYLYNNTGYCLNARDLHVEAEGYCRRALEIDSTAAYAFKNLGISLYGQGDFTGAAWCWTEAINADPSNPHAPQLLNLLLNKHPELKAQCHSIAALTASQRPIGIN
jgi:tetratricopeptide (TPR) repeat protein